jgi:hypothetical protein
VPNCPNKSSLTNISRRGLVPYIFAIKLHWISESGELHVENKNGSNALKTFSQSKSVAKKSLGYDLKSFKFLVLFA